MCEQSGTGDTEKQLTPRIYVASLADYNAGRLHGRWIDADQPAETIRERIAEMLTESREPIAEEWAIHDYENFGDLGLSEFEDLDHVAQVAQSMVDYGPVFAGLVAHLGGTSAVEEAVRYMESSYRGAFDSVADYAQELVEESYGDALRGLPDVIRYHVDYEGIGRDLELGGDIFTVACGGTLHIFDSCI